MPESLKTIASTLTPPTVTLDGTGKGQLRFQFEQAAMALDKALDVMVNARPHARDYFRGGPNDLERAQAEHDNRIARIRGILKEYQALALILGR